MVNGVDPSSWFPEYTSVATGELIASDPNCIVATGSRFAVTTTAAVATFSGAGRGVTSATLCATVWDVLVTADDEAGSAAGIDVCADELEGTVAPCTGCALRLFFCFARSKPP